ALPESGADEISSLPGQARRRYGARSSGGDGRSQRVPSRGVPDRVRRARRLDEPDLPSAVEACRPLVVVVRAAAGFVGVRLRVAQLVALEERLSLKRAGSCRFGVEWGTHLDFGGGDASPIGVYAAVAA